MNASPHQPNATNQADSKEELLKNQINKLKNKIVVLSGKGGVGKSTVAANIAVSLALKGKTVGLLDIDFHGPSLPKLLGLEGTHIQASGDGIEPLYYSENLKVMSIGFLLQNQDDAVIWRGPLKMGAIKQFLTDVEWGTLDYLVVDSPPGTGDEPLSIIQILGPGTKAVIVTTPQDLSLSDVRKSITFCRKLDVEVIGVLENMSGFVCPNCGERIDIFKTGGGATMAAEMGVPFLGRIPLDPQIVVSGDSGQPYVDKFAESESAKSFEIAILPILALSEKIPVAQSGNLTPQPKSGTSLRFAFPLAGGVVSGHFGHAEKFLFLDVDPATHRILKEEMLTPPPHEPGVIPRWLAEQKANLLFTGGIGSRAKEILAENHIETITGVTSKNPKEIVADYFENNLEIGEDCCDH
jgi:Mrp family chromosome partitioning ATPase/predicted Fe-Mo cluster-binding NifX family protein